MICSTKNPRIKNLLKLEKSSKYRRECGLFVVEGIKSIKEAHHYCTVEDLYISEAWLSANRGSTDDEGLFDWLCGQDLLDRESVTRVEVLSGQVFEKISDTVTPQGLMAAVKFNEYDLELLLKKEKLFLIVLENLSDPGNMGTIVRTAEGAGADAVILGGGCVDAFSPKVVRSTMGALFRMPVFSYSDAGFTELLKRLKQNGIKLYGAHLRGSVSYDEMSYGNRAGIIIGNESKGITEGTLEFTDSLVKIPMEGRVESLNASVAAGILMYEVYRQRRKI